MSACVCTATSATWRARAAPRLARSLPNPAPASPPGAVADAVREADKVLAKAAIMLDIYERVEVQLITGRGAHSVDGVARVREAVEEHLCQRGIPYAVHNAGGMLVASLTA